MNEPDPYLKIWFHDGTYLNVHSTAISTLDNHFVREEIFQSEVIQVRARVSDDNIRVKPALIQCYWIVSAEERRGEAEIGEQWVEFNKSIGLDLEEKEEWEE